MGSETLTQSPFSVVTFIVAPALLTNASSVLAMSTINRMLRTRERMHQLFSQSQRDDTSETDSARLLDQVNRVEKQAVLFLRALHSIYLALGAFAGATLVTLIGASVETNQSALLFRIPAALGLILGVVGVGGLLFGCVNLFRATQLSLVSIRDEAEMIRARQARPPNPPR